MNETKDAVPTRAERHAYEPSPPDDRDDRDDTGDDRARARTGEMVDSALLDDITLLAEVITSVARYPRHLKGDEVDDVLGVD